MTNLKFVLIVSVLLLLVANGVGRAADTVSDALTTMDKIKKYNLYHILSTYTTHFNPQEANRTQNIKVGAWKLNGTLIKPGEVFSFNQTVGPRTKERGFKEAPEIINSQLVEGVGGGVCQVSSTLYNAILLADLQVVERVHHSQPVNYVDLGRGATVYYNKLDFKFENNTDFPVLIMARLTDNRLTVSLLGRESKVQVEIFTSTPEILKPAVKQEIDNTLPPGQKKVVNSGRQGYKVTVKKIVRKEGEVVNKEIISQDIYSPEARIIKIHPKE